MLTINLFVERVQIHFVTNYNDMQQNGGTLVFEPKRIIKLIIIVPNLKECQRSLVGYSFDSQLDSSPYNSAADSSRVVNVSAISYVKEVYFP